MGYPEYDQSVKMEEKVQRKSTEVGLVVLVVLMELGAAVLANVGGDDEEVTHHQSWTLGLQENRTLNTVRDSVPFQRI